jgi:hypothetical protein
MRAYSEDLRTKVVEAVNRGMKKCEASYTFGLSLSSVKRYVEARCEGRSLLPKKRPGMREHTFKGTVPGTFLGVPGNGKRISFRLLHIWEFREGLISRENIWMDGGSVVAQLTSDEKEEVQLT